MPHAERYRFVQVVTLIGISTSPHIAQESLLPMNVLNPKFLDSERVHFIVNTLSRIVMGDPTMT